MRNLLVSLVTVTIVATTSHTSARETIPADLVLHASDATTLSGTWQRVNDASAAGGVRVWHPDAAAPKVATPAATPRDYFEVSFRAEAGRSYRLWIRGQAQNNSYNNDSVYVQFSGAVDANNASAYRIGSSSAATVVLENCSGCGVAGWGWQDNEYGGIALGPEIRFAATGAQTLRIQGREDGISIDQIVLSSAAYFSTPPGAFKNDTKILEKTTVTPTTGSGPVGFTFAPNAGGAAFDAAAAVDVNGDARPDLVGIFDNEPITIVSVLNRGNRTFQGVQSTETAGGPDTVNTVAVDDFNRDGRKDLLYLNRSRDILIMVPGDGAGHFDVSTAVGTSFGENVEDFAVADFNRDGILDVVTIEPEAGAAVVHLGDGTGRFSFVSFATTAAGPGYVTAGDVNSDGCVDAVAVSQANDTISILPGDCTGRFRPRSQLFAGFAPRAIALGDLNGDSRLDIVVANPTDVSYYLSTTGGAWSARADARSTTTFDATVRDRALTIVDVNGDGLKDLIVGHVHVGFNRTGVWPSISILYGDGSGDFAAPDEFASHGSAAPIAADFDADGRMDLVATSSASVYWNQPLTPNQQPVANAGDDVTVAVSQQATLTLSSRSTDPDAHLLTYSWTDASGDVFSNGALARPFEFVQKPAGTYTFTLTVNDLHGAVQSDTVNVTLQNDATGTNRPPVAHANASLEGVWHYEQQFQDEPDPQTYLWSDSTDPDGDPLSYEWRDETGNLLGTSDGIGHPRLRPGPHTITLTVRDGRGGQSQHSVTVNVLTYEEIYISNGYKESARGQWQEAEVPASEGAAANIVVRDTDLGAPKVTTPLAAPASYAEYSFVADPTVEYKLWIRLKAQNNFFGNDSVWVQFTGATNAAGDPVFRTGTTSGLAIVLEECSGCGISGWGWRDDAWGAAGAMSSTFVRFPAGGVQTIRIQTREDGVSIDQIALSARKYKTTRPGAVKNDTTFLPFTAMWGT